MASDAERSTPGGTGIVVIGRNEGDRLKASLASALRFGCPVVYVDSGSRDRSPEVAERLGASVVHLDPVRAFTAARARNEGFERLVSIDAATEHVQFLDGDCTLAPGWLAVAAAALDADPGCAIVIGHLQELHPESSVYNRLCALEWKSPAGLIENFGALGGIMMVRASAFSALGGFNQDVIAGEDSELGVRTGLSGRTVRKLDAPMAVHDADMHRFREWWVRSVRAGHAIGQRAMLGGRSRLRDCVRELRSAAFWSMGVPALVLLLAWPTGGWSLLLLPLAYGLLGFRIYRYRRRRGDSAGDALLYARFTVLGRFANGLGLVRFWLNRALGRYRIIEYK